LGRAVAYSRRQNSAVLHARDIPGAKGENMRFIGFLAAALLAATPASADFDAVLTYARLGDTAKVIELLRTGDDPNPPEYHHGYSPLQFAAGEGDVEMTKALLAAGAGTEYRDHNGDRALLWAAERGHAATVKLLLDAGSPADADEDPYGLTPAMVAAKTGHADVLNLVLAAGANPARWDQTGMTALHYAARLDDPAAVEMLLAAGANPNVFEEISLETPLHETARWSSGAVVKALVAAGAALDARTDEGKTPLFAAADVGNAEIVAALLAAYADADAKAMNGGTPILAAMGLHHEIHSRQDAVALALAEVTEDIDRAFSTALWNGFPNVALRLLERGADVNAVDAEGRPALAAASLHPGLTYFQLLVLRGADIGKHGSEAMLTAASYGRSDIVRRLVELGVPADTRDARGATPLLRAAGAGAVETVRYLLSVGADPNAEDMFGGGVQAYMEIRPAFYQMRIDERSASRAYRPTLELEGLLETLRTHHAEIRELLALE
jgi:ankyrin repeat protein